MDRVSVMGRRGDEVFALCVTSGDYPASLEPHKWYRVLPDENAEANGELRVVDESGEDYLYPAEYFAPMPHLQRYEVGNVRAWLENHNVFEIRRAVPF